MKTLKNMGHHEMNTLPGKITTKNHYQRNVFI